MTPYDTFSEQISVCYLNFLGVDEVQWQFLIIHIPFCSAEPVSLPDLEADADMEFAEPWSGGDVTFVIEERKIYANKVILSMWSPVMESMFTSDFKEKNAPEIPLPGKKFTHFQKLMKYVHPPNDPITGEVFCLLRTVVEKWFLKRKFCLKKYLNIHPQIY